MVPDYYAMLEIEPNANRAEIEAALARRQPIWSSGTRNPKTKLAYQSYLDQIPTIRQTLLGDPPARAAFDAELAASRRMERDRKLDELQRLLRLRSAKGGLSVTDRTVLRDEAVKLGLSHDDLDRLAESIPARPEPPKLDDDADSPVDVIDSATRRQIKVALEHLNKRNLYDVLDLPHDAPSRELSQSADALRRRWMQKSQITAEKTAWLEAVSYAQSHLANPEARARYDRTLTADAEEMLNTTIEFALRGLNRLDSATREAIVDDGAGFGVLPERANQLIDRHCKTLGIARDGGPADLTAKGPPRLLRCRSCGRLNPFGQTVPGRAPDTCRECGDPLAWDCPVCQKPHMVDVSRCSCGFLLVNREPMLRHFEAAQHAHKIRDYDAALAHLQEVQHYAPRHVGARKAIEKLKERIGTIDRLRQTYATEFARKHLVAAREAAEGWARLVDPSSPDLREALSSVTEALRSALSLATEANRLASDDPRQARQLYRRSLAIAGDLPEARDGLRRLPPDPPTDLKAEFDGRKVHLRWKAPPPDGGGVLTFRVLRKRLATPGNSADGTRIGEVSAAECDDAKTAPGETVCYAVYCVRDGNESLTGAVAGPLLILGEVSDVVIEAKSREVLLSWSPPVAAAGVTVVRKAGFAPAGPTDGEPVEALRERAVDRNLNDDRVYHYGIYVQYKSPDGRTLHSRGVTCAAMPHAPITPLTGLKLNQEPGGRLRLSWPLQARGNVRIVRSTGPLGLAAGVLLSQENAKSIAGTWIEPATSTTAFDDRPPALGVCYYTPLTSWAGTLVVGTPLAFSNVPDPSDLRAARVPGGRGKVHVRWRWSPQGGRSLLLARAGNFATGPDDPEALVFEVLENEYSRLGYFAVTLPAEDAGPWHLSVRSVAQVEGEAVVSAGLEPSARTIVATSHPDVTVAYHLRAPRIPGRPWSITFRTEPEGAVIPPMAMVVHPRTVPLTVDDGEIIDQFPASRDGATFRIRPRLNRSPRRARVFLDPSAAPDGLSPVRLKHPETDETRV
jgi:hypothetical protein